ncbi:hypothetical protein Pmar_PMAR024893 [Perkinsus marinus ATCC 50983]|uniref:Uncharacterized protein n=1 Tax=Perkinsus marinus (strain ATCC 50983 / TXsc) TaxID=423536 RepID=C5LCX7_PERM5|nr:hypothetical protein Pmar_PMAR024893 [Perkinsus marinus ATCC 50983]EER05430.1 hypothetical protein Pmar_PMAR024893 [Perkinsus marinus ATCC 50983]|eukprot:XP_002773614.1 hypothetical protein Pmar_PMAR024893 [Perkinsus marinus ATCC 50983]
MLVNDRLNKFRCRLTLVPHPPTKILSLAISVNKVHDKVNLLSKQGIYPIKLVAALMVTRSSTLGLNTLYLIQGVILVGYIRAKS